jgi:hypothetical protein
MEEVLAKLGIFIAEGDSVNTKLTAVRRIK